MPTLGATTTLPDLASTVGYLVADSKGRLVGRVECSLHGTSPDTPDALSVKTGLFSQHRSLVRADAIKEINGRSQVIALRVDRGSVLRFL